LTQIFGVGVVTPTRIPATSTSPPMATSFCADRNTSRRAVARWLLDLPAHWAGPKNDRERPVGRFRAQAFN
jgi:hypothetical protein